MGLIREALRVWDNIVTRARVKAITRPSTRVGAEIVVRSAKLFNHRFPMIITIGVAKIEPIKMIFK